MDHILLPWHDPQTQRALDSGVFDQSDGWVAIQSNSEGISFKRITDPKPSLLWRIFKAMRVISLTATFMPALATVLLLILLDVPINWGNTISSILALLLLQVAVNIFNDVADYKKLIDLPDSLGGSGVIQQAWLTSRQMSYLAWSSLFLSGLFALPAIMYAPVPVLICALVAFFGVLGYSGWPFYFKYKGLGDVVVWLLCGPLLVFGMSSAVSGVFWEPVLFVGFYFGFAATAILNANNMNDMKIDLASGATTLAIKLGFTNARLLQIIYYLGVVLSSCALAWFFGPWLLLPLIATPLVALQCKKLYSVHTGCDDSLKDIRFDAAKTHLLLGILLCIAISISVWLS
ncbi:prenyltransferase [Bermanella marisrubri]|uniref:1,4-dihydroxy-2-naphthoate octaprenyltransferase, putative n=2 Tax=Bermanella marisrubri TaxID=207949 RepID=Q1N672_9GAMM|nr:prenyltransferase [Bermanella marisrubri]EAT13720.1 1,4-dihydroxy-2-naphthoate octaprenyltransferase, putative [Oceanobacter sp. RED65] [Bermanella marisrubri]QIZ84496.1 prenyltransferase [Bermanella marisrubri]